MKKLNITEKKTKLFIVLGGALLLAAAIAFAFFSCGGKDSPSQKLNEKIRIAATVNNISEDAVRNDKMIMEQINMELAQEEKIDKLSEDIKVTDEEIKNYRNMIGSTMDTKKAILVIFNTADECQSFIAEHGADSNPEKARIGMLPLMERDADGKEYYNVVGNDILEGAFDGLKDGEFSKTPIEFSGIFAYLKRIELTSPVQDDEEIKNLIKTEKAHEKLSEGR
ncbi:MAG: hypothetical protein BWY15_02265 [Firmicutes bacterium ADurb.Bin193]|nr:MAG: hypothetical protein BWY15_02265 [Firmicutes bacterium ADurb.Bin193]